MKRFLEAGRLTSVRGLQGELRFECWCDSLDFLVGVQKLYLDSEGRKALDIRVYRPSVPSIAFQGYEDRETASILAGKTVYFDREEVVLEDGVFFNADLIGLDVYNNETGDKIGVLTDVIESVASMLYRIEGNEIYLIPAIPEFVKDISLSDGIKIKLIDGFEGLTK